MSVLDHLSLRLRFKDLMTMNLARVTSQSSSLLHLDEACFLACAVRLIDINLSKGLGAFCCPVNHLWKSCEFIFPFVFSNVYTTE
jgi:hypothetical protein